MDQFTFHSPVDRKFILQDPTSSKYSGRLTNDDKARLEPLLLRLHDEGASRGDMLAECNNILATSITPAQLDGLRTKLGMHIYRRRHLEVPSGSMRGRPGVETPPLTTVIFNSEGVEITAQSLDSQDVQLDAPTVHFQNLSLDSNNSLRNIQEAQYDVGSDELESVNFAQNADLGTSEDVNEGTPQELSTVGYLLATDTSPSTIDKTPIALPPLPPLSLLLQMEPNENKQLRITDLVGMHSNHRDTLQSSNFAISQRPHVAYNPSQRVLRIYQAFLVGERGVPRTARLIRVATLLHTLRAFDDAFDLFYMLYDSIPEAQTLDDPLHPLLVFAAIACARSAQSKLQFQVAYGLVSHVRALTMPLQSMHVLVVAGLTSFEQILLQITKGTSAQMPLEDSFEAAVWTLAPLAMTQWSETTIPWPRGWSTAVAISSAVKHTLRFLQSLDKPRLAILRGLEFVSSHIEKHAEEFDRIIRGTHWSLFNNVASTIARRLSYSILQERSLKLTTAGFPLEETQISEIYHFDASLHILAITAIPFALVDWMGQFGPKYYFRDAIKQLQLNCYSKVEASGSFPIFDLFFDQMAAPASGRHSPVEKLSAERLVAVCGAVVVGGTALDMPIYNLPQEPPDSHVGFEHEIQAERRSQRSSTLLPTMAESIRASNSSSLRSFLSTASRARKINQGISESRESTISDARTSRSSGKLSFMSLTASIRMSTRHSLQSISSDVEMTG